MSHKVNNIRNPNFTRGREVPDAWDWVGGDSCTYVRRDDANGTSTIGVLIKGDKPTSCGAFVQDVRCKPNTHYRLEAVVSCDVDADDGGGCMLTLAEVLKSGDVSQEWCTPPITRTDEPTTIRAFRKTSGEAKTIRIHIGLRNARGSARIHVVRLIRILEPDIDSHALAVPPPPRALAPDRAVESVALISNAPSDRPLATVLRAFFGPDYVQYITPGAKAPAAGEFDALLLPDATPPRFVRAQSSLLKLAADRIVIISLPAFASLTRGQTPVKRIEQDDDPIHAKVVYGDFATHGFALHDIFPYAWAGETPGSFVQHQFRKSKAFDDYCRKHKLTPLLASMCDRDDTSDRPIALFRRTANGCLFVLDLHPVEGDCSTLGETNLAAQLLLSVLGQQVTALGQYILPFEVNETFRSNLREMSVRFQGLRVLDPDLPAADVSQQIVTIGGDDESYGLPLKPKPVIIVRSGLTGGDVESVYAALLWIKLLVRMAPHRCPYVDALSSAFRIAWIPCVADWEHRFGWQPSGETPDAATEIDSENAQVAAMIDLASRSGSGCRVVTSSDGEFCRHLSLWLPQLTGTFNTGHGLTYAPRGGAPAANRASYIWQRTSTTVDVTTTGEGLDQSAHRDVRRSGGEVVRLEIPGCGADFNSYSVQRTDIGATLLEHVVGLIYGLLAVNRTRSTISFDGFPPCESGSAIIARAGDPMLRLDRSHAV